MTGCYGDDTTNISHLPPARLGGYYLQRHCRPPRLIRVPSEVRNLCSMTTMNELRI